MAVNAVKWHRDQGCDSLPQPDPDKIALKPFHACALYITFSLLACWDSLSYLLFELTALSAFRLNTLRLWCIQLWLYQMDCWSVTIEIFAQYINLGSKRFWCYMSRFNSSSHFIQIKSFCVINTLICNRKCFTQFLRVAMNCQGLLYWMKSDSSKLQENTFYCLKAFPSSLPIP